MIRSLWLCVAVGAYPALSACAPVGDVEASIEPNSAPSTCFHTDHLRNFRAANANVVYVRAASRGAGVYEIATSGGCMGLENAAHMSINPALPTGSSRVCVGDSVTLGSAATSMMGGQCEGRVTRALTQAEVEALPARSRP